MFNEKELRIAAKTLMSMCMDFSMGGLEDDVFRSNLLLFAKQANPSIWSKPSEKLPERVPNVRYSQVPCIVIRHNHPEMLVFNHEHNCWDDASGDDFAYAINDVDLWTAVPNWMDALKRIRKD